MTATDETLPLAVLDFVGIEYGESPSASVAGAVGIARAVEAAGYRRYWVSEHHNMTSLACSAPELLTAHVGALTARIRVGAAGIMLPNHAPLKVAETFRTLLAMYPGRIDLALGRAPGTDPLTAHVLRRGMVADPAAEFPGQVAELLAFLGDGFPAGHPYAPLVAAPVVDERPELFVLGSSGYGPRFAAVNGMSAVFAHHMSPEIAFEACASTGAASRPGRRTRTVLGDVRARLRQRGPGGGAGLRGGVDADDRQYPPRGTASRCGRSRCGSWPDRRSSAPGGRDDGRMVTGEPKAVAERLLEMKAARPGRRDRRRHAQPRPGAGAQAASPRWRRPGGSR